MVYDSGATNLVGGDLNGQNDVFIRNLAAGTTKMVSLSSGEAKGNNFSGDASISMMFWPACAICTLIETCWPTRTLRVSMVSPSRRTVIWAVPGEAP